MSTTIQYNTIQYNTIQYNTIQYNSCILISSFSLRYQYLLSLFNLTISFFTIQLGKSTPNLHYFHVQKPNLAARQNATQWPYL